jgi:hypothetical protein
MNIQVFISERWTKILVRIKKNNRFLKITKYKVDPVYYYFVKWFKNHFVDLTHLPFSDNLCSGKTKSQNLS